MRIFIADDTDTELLTRQLESAGHAVVGTTNLAIGLTAAVRPHAEKGPLVVLVDLDWRGRPNVGVDIAKLCKRETGARVYICSARDPSDLRKAKETAGVDGYFWKGDPDASIADRIARLERLGAFD